MADRFGGARQSGVLFVVGGDGTCRGAMTLVAELKKARA